MKKIILNKLAIILGLIFATLNLIFPGYSFILCSINPNRDFCSEAGFAMFINWPTIEILAWPFSIFGIQNEQLMFGIVALSGLIQYFIIGYLVGQLIVLLKNQVKRLF